MKKKLTSDSHYVRKVSSGFKYFLLIFVIRLGQSLKEIGLDAELHSTSNGNTFEGVHRVKNRAFTLFYEYILLIFAIRLGQSLKVFGLDTELNSLSDGGIFEGSHRAKTGVLTPYIEF